MSKDHVSRAWLSSEWLTAVQSIGGSRMPPVESIFLGGARFREDHVKRTPAARAFELRIVDIQISGGYTPRQ